jgi:glycosyltransferase involved in cell wall biosynthesis
MRVAHFVQRWPPALGGSETYFAHLSRYLAAAGHEVVVFTTTALDLPFWSRRGRHAAAGWSEEAGVRVHRSPAVPFLGQRLALKALSLLPHRGLRAWTLTSNPLAWEMKHLADTLAERFDVVHATAFPYAWPILCARRLARRQGVPFLLTPFVHTGDPDDPQDPVRRTFTQPALTDIARTAERVFVQTEGEWWALANAGVSPERLVQQGMGVEVTDCTGGDGEAARREWQIPPAAVLVGHLANKSREKGSVDLLEAAAKAWAKGAEFFVVLAGSEMPNFRAAARRFGGDRRVRLLPVLDERQKRDFFAALDVFALPSRVESFGLVLLEAWANGVPNLAYRAGGVADVIRDGQDGLLVRCGDVDGLARELSRLAADPERRRALGAAGRQRVRSEFRWQDKARIVERVYEEITGRAAGEEELI